MSRTPPNDMSRWLELIQAEYREIPGLNLTWPQVRRLWSLDDRTCDALLDRLVSTQFLEKTPRDAYVLAGRSRP
jgi:hypothetical protein